jgi:hypothetical protein
VLGLHGDQRLGRGIFLATGKGEQEQSGGDSG